jgi:hypothetical protein
MSKPTAIDDGVRQEVEGVACRDLELGAPVAVLDLEEERFHVAQMRRMRVIPSQTTWEFRV